MPIRSTLAVLSLLLATPGSPLPRYGARPTDNAQTQRPIALSLPFVVHVHNESGLGSVNSYWITTREGVVVIDAQRSLTSANNLIQKIQASGKPVIAIFLTHPHPDHYTGLAALKKAYPAAPIYASQGTQDSMRSDYRHYLSSVNERIRSDAPDGIPLPDHIVSPSQEIEIGGVRLRAEEIGAGESEAMTILYVPDRNILFSSDIIGNHMTPYLVEGRLAAWVKQIDTVANAYKQVKTVYPGHGRSGPLLTLLVAQKDYLITFRNLVSQQLSQDGALTPAGKQAVVKAMQVRYRNYPPVADIPDLLDKNVEAVAKELQTP